SSTPSSTCRFSFTHPATTWIYTLSLHDALPIFAQLHQLRGRVGRGAHKSYCVLLADPKTEIGKERMQSMTETTDGFRLAEKDLRSEEHTSELQSRENLVCRLLLEKKNRRPQQR